MKSLGSAGREVKTRRKKQDQISLSRSIERLDEKNFKNYI